MRRSRVVVLVAWWFLCWVSAGQRGGLTTVGPFATHEQCDAMRSEVANQFSRGFAVSSWATQCWEQG